MSPAFSAYLDALRLLSALVVFAHHASYPRFGGQWISILGGFGHEAVMVFFVLSGYVVTYVVDTKERNFGDYFASRMSRLWSVALPAIGLTLMMDAAGRALDATTYDEPLATLGSVLTSAAFLNEIWFAEITPGSNIPYWSLSYEFMYYVLFGAFAFFPRRILFGAIVALVAGPKILLLLPAWLLGNLTYRLTSRQLTAIQAWVWAIGGASVALSIAALKIGNIYVTWRWERLFGSQVFAIFGHSDAFVSDNLIAVGVAANLLGMARLLRNTSLPIAFRSAIHRFSLATFPIYLLHYPSLYFFTALSIALTGTRHGVSIGLASLVIGFIVTPVAELLKRALRHALRGTLDSLDWRLRLLRGPSD